MDASTSTAARLQWSLVSLLIMYTAVSILSPIACTPAIFFIVLVVIGIVGTHKRHSGLLKFYWIVQFISLFVMIVGFIFILIMYYQHRAEIVELQNKQFTVNQQLALECFAFAFFVIDLVLKVRSMVLAQRLAKQLQVLPHLENELNNISEESSVQDPNTQPIYVIPQPMFAAPPQINTTTLYPSNLIPIYVDSYGNPILQTNIQHM